MTDMQVVELEQTIATSVGSNTIEWALNMRICDMIQANPSLAPCLMRELVTHLRKETPVPVLLGLSLLEIVVKNCGFQACRYIDERLSRTLVSLVKKREGWQYSLSRNLFKSAGGALGGISEEHRNLWVQVSHKVREMLQLWADAFLLQEGKLQPIFTAYKSLRKDGYTFPEKERGASAELCLIHGAEESPAFQAAGGSVTGGDTETEISEAAVDSSTRGGVAPATAPAASAGAGNTGADHELQEAQHVLQELRELQRGSGDDGRRCTELEQRVRSAREWATQLIQQHMEDDSGNVDAERLQAVILLLDELNELSASAAPEQPSGAANPVTEDAATEAHQTDLLDLGGEAVAESSCAAAGASDSSAPPLPPPPSEAPPDREQQELYDLILARYLQERENEGFFANEEEDAALALRLSLEEGGGQMDVMYSTPPRPLDRVSCARCGAVNQLDSTPRGPSSLFVCYGCGTTQLVPVPPMIGGAAHMPGGAAAANHNLAVNLQRQARSAEDVRPTRHAPPPRVICAGGNASPELFIGGGAAAAETATAPTSGAPPAARPSKMESFEGGVGREALLGAPVSNTSANIRSWMPSWPGGTSSASHTKKLGDGAPESEYMAMSDEVAPFFDGGGPPPAGSSASSGLKVSGLLPWKSRKKATEDTKEPLLERVRVDEEWELIRPADTRPYWHNSVTQASQWQPPDVVSQRRGTS